MKPVWVYSDVEQDKWLDGPFAICADVEYYFDNRDEIDQWLLDNDPQHGVTGVVINFSSREKMLMFRFRWDADVV